MRSEIPFLNFDSQHLTIHQEMMSAIENVLNSNSFILANSSIIRLVKPILEISQVDPTGEAINKFYV